MRTPVRAPEPACISAPRVRKVGSVRGDDTEDSGQSLRHRGDRWNPMVAYATSSPDVTVLHGDAYDLLPSLAPESVDLLITSPPYWGFGRTNKSTTGTCSRIGSAPVRKRRTSRATSGTGTMAESSDWSPHPIGTWRIWLKSSIVSAQLSKRRGAYGSISATPISHDGPASGPQAVKVWEARLARGAGFRWAAIAKRNNCC